MKDWLWRFFAVDNSVNEDTVMGCIFAVAFLVCCFVPYLSGSIIPTGSAMGAFFGKNVFKKETIDGFIQQEQARSKESK